jgi:hypothetical protein
MNSLCFLFKNIPFNRFYPIIVKRETGYEMQRLYTERLLLREWKVILDRFDGKEVTSLYYSILKSEYQAVSKNVKVQK